MWADGGWSGHNPLSQHVLETAELVDATRVKACFSNSQPAVTHPWVELIELIKS